MEFDLESLEQELATALASFKPFLLKRSWIYIPKTGSEIGVGGFGIVHRGVLQRGIFTTRMNVAVKKLHATGERGKRVTVALDLVRELRIQSTLNHPNVLPLLGFYLSVSLDEAWIVSPYAAKGNIYEYLECTCPGMDKRLALAKDTAMGLVYLHTRSPPICHGDIKALNILVSANDRAMLCDFGLSKALEGVTTATNANNVGTSRYRSPELFVDGNCPTLESDVWAWGCLLFEVVTGRVPYDETLSEGTVIHYIQKKVLPAALDTLDKCPSHVRELLTDCWKIAPGLRPSMEQTLVFLSAGNLRFLATRKQHDNTTETAAIQTTTVQLDSLERELIKIMEPIQQFRIKPSRLDFPKGQHMIGVGGCGTVFRALLRPRTRGSKGDVVAVKQLRAGVGRSKCLRITIALIRELVVWAWLSHENIVPLLGFHISKGFDQAWLVSPYMANGNISAYISRVRPGDEERLSLSLDTAYGLQYLHNLDPPVCHGDIKALNVLVNDDRRAVLCDFGLAKAMETLPSGLTTSTFNLGGSLPYESPELVLGTSLRSPRSDVWAWGCLLQEIFTGKSPYYLASNPGVVVKWIVQDIPPTTPDDVPCPGDCASILLSESCCDEVNGPMQANPVIQQLREDCGVSRANILKRTNILFDEEASVGSGSFGTVFRATLVDEVLALEGLAAVKQLRVPSNPNLRLRLHAEVAMKADRWSSFTHPNLLKLVGFYSATPDPLDEMLLVFPYMAGGNLNDYLTTSPEYSRKMALADDVCQGLLYLHTRSPPICHGSLHPNNVLIGPDGHIMLSDYDLLGLQAKPSTTELKRYQSPEQLTDSSKPGTSADIWAYGCIFLKIVTGRDPYQGASNDDLVGAISRRTFPAPIDDLECSARAQNVLGICWQWELTLRTKIGEVGAIISGKLCWVREAWSTVMDRDVGSLTFSPRGNYLVVRHIDYIQIYEGVNFALLCGFPIPKRSSGHLATQGPSCVRMSRSESLLAVSSQYDQCIWLWDIETRKLKETYEGHEEVISALDISPDDSVLVSGSLDCTVRVWQIGHQNSQPLVFDFPTGVASLTFHDSFSALAVSCRYGISQLVNPRDGNVMATLDGKGHYQALWFSPDSQRLYGGSVHGELNCWEIGDLSRSTDTLKPITMKAAEEIITAVVASSSWVVFTSLAVGETRVHLLDATSVSETSEKILGEDLHVSGLSPISEDGSGFVAFLPQSRDIVVYKYQTWDKPGLYKLYDGRI